VANIQCLPHTLGQKLCVHTGTIQTHYIVSHLPASAKDVAVSPARRSNKREGFVHIARTQACVAPLCVALCVVVPLATLLNMNMRVDGGDVVLTLTYLLGTFPPIAGGNNDASLRPACHTARCSSPLPRLPLCTLWRTAARNTTHGQAGPLFGQRFADKLRPIRFA